ncbi:MAG: hypothetical protein LBE09_06330 [Christensenellaceae bacterium]|jgi:hypothetical protein|nr:hypothetical protein [Christensenellaceae bacterium]
MRKALLVLTVMLAIIISLTGCVTQRGNAYDTYFKNFISQTGYSKVEEVLRLSDQESFKDRNIIFSSYDDASGVYILSEESISYGSDNVMLYGFATIEEGVLIAPRYENVLDIKGDYAIVTRRVAIGDISESKVYIGLVKLRGDNAGKEYGFSYIYMPLIVQYAFLNEKLLVMLGYKTLTSEETLTYTSATVYDYASSGGSVLLTVGVISDVSNDTTFKMCDGHIVSIYCNIARFYRVDEITSNGYFLMKGSFSPFDTTAGYAETDITLQAYYIGSGWFILSGVHTTTTSTGIYDMVQYDANGTAQYVTIKSASYNTVHYKSFEIQDRVALVANKYSDEEIRGIINLLNSAYDIDDYDGKGLYYQPAVAMSSAIKDGYSIVYYYYYQQIDGFVDWPITFTIYDENARATNLNTIFPLLYVDGIGLYNSDPNFDMPPLSADYYKYYSTERVIITPLQDTVGYNTAIAHDEMIISYNVTVSGLTADTYVGAYDRNGALAVPYLYFEFTPYFSGYATASRLQGGASDTERLFFRISKSGAETQLDDVFMLRNGVYVTYHTYEDGIKYGLKANDGTLLIENICDTVSTVDTFLTKDGKYIETAVVTVEDGLGVIYKLT